MKLVLLLALLLALLVHPGVEAGSKESQACNICRKEKEPASSKFPDGVSSCSDGFYPSAVCPVVQNTHSEGGGSLNGADCHTDPYRENCSKKETKHPQKHNSTKKQSNHTNATSMLIWLGVFALIAGGLACIGIMGLMSMRNKQMPGMYQINVRAQV